MKRSAILAFICIFAVSAGFAISRFLKPTPHKAAPSAELTQTLPRTLTGRIVRIIDGDTVDIVADVAQRRIRLAGIDAPEHDQDFGQKSKQHLSAMVFNKDVRILATKLDSYGRTIGQIFDGDKDINLEMVKVGLALALQEI